MWCEKIHEFSSRKAPIIGMWCNRPWEKKRQMKKTMKSEYMLFYQSCIISMEISFFIRFPFTGYCMCVCVFVSISLSIPSARCRSPPLQKKEIKMMPVDWICFFLSAFSKMQSSKRFVTLKLGIFMVRAEEQNIKKKAERKRRVMVGMATNICYFSRMLQPNFEWT